METKERRKRFPKRWTGLKGDRGKVNHFAGEDRGSKIG